MNPFGFLILLICFTFGTATAQNERVVVDSVIAQFFKQTTPETNGLHGVMMFESVIEDSFIEMKFEKENWRDDLTLIEYLRDRAGAYMTSITPSGVLFVWHGNTGNIRLELFDPTVLKVRRYNR